MSLCSFFLVNLPFTLAVGKNPSAPHLSILFRAAEKENRVARECLPVPFFFLVNVPFTYAMYFFFLCDQKTGTYPSDPRMFILFRTAEKERTKISREPKSLISCESLRHSKRRPPETPIPLRMSVIAKWAKLASLKQNAHF